MSQGVMRAKESLQARSYASQVRIQVKKLLQSRRGSGQGEVGSQGKVQDKEKFEVNGESRSRRS